MATIRSPIFRSQSERPRLFRWATKFPPIFFAYRHLPDSLLPQMPHVPKEKSAASIQPFRFCQGYAVNIVSVINITYKSSLMMF